MQITEAPERPRGYDREKHENWQNGREKAFHSLFAFGELLSTLI